MLANRGTISMTHQQIDARSLAMGRIIADRLRRDPSLIKLAVNNIDRWSKTCSPRSLAVLAEWRQALQSPLENVIELLTGMDERSVRMRQSNPFAGVIPPHQRSEVLRQFRESE